jgi:RNA polymerase sigma-70 factor (ECF subfamily)
MSGRPIEADQRPSGRVSDALLTPASTLAAEIKALVVAGEREAARDRFGSLVALLQRRGLRIAYHYLRDAADADEAVQDAFVKVFLHIEQYREELSFDVWFMRILVNACLDRLKSRTRQQRWIAAPIDDTHDERPVEQVAGTAPSTEQELLAREQWQQVLNAVATLPDRQRLVFTLSHLDERTAGEISEATGMSPATVRVHLFRAIRKLRATLGESQ